MAEWRGDAKTRRVRYGCHHPHKSSYYRLGSQVNPLCRDTRSKNGRDEKKFLHQQHYIKPSMEIMHQANRPVVRTFSRLQGTPRNSPGTDINPCLSWRAESKESSARGGAANHSRATQGSQGRGGAPHQGLHGCCGSGTSTRMMHPLRAGLQDGQSDGRADSPTGHHGCCFCGRRCSGGTSTQTILQTLRILCIFSVFSSPSSPSASSC